MHIWLLTHSEELKKANGTGQLITQCLPELSTVVIWHRTEPSQDILSLPLDQTLLIYPTPEKDAQTISSFAPFVEQAKHIIILDGTWQQAKKMYNRSPYLQKFSTYEISGVSSCYIRRKNQQKSGLCTAESAIHLLKQQQLDEQAKQLEAAFLKFNQSI